MSHHINPGRDDLSAATKAARQRQSDQFSALSDADFVTALKALTPGNLTEWENTFIAETDAELQNNIATTPTIMTMEQVNDRIAELQAFLVANPEIVLGPDPTANEVAAAASRANLRLQVQQNIDYFQTTPPCCQVPPLDSLRRQVGERILRGQAS